MRQRYFTATITLYDFTNEQTFSQPKSFNTMTPWTTVNFYFIINNFERQSTNILVYMYLYFFIVYHCSFLNAVSTIRREVSYFCVLSFCFSFFCIYKIFYRQYVNFRTFFTQKLVQFHLRYKRFCHRTVISDMS